MAENRPNRRQDFHGNPQPGRSPDGKPVINDQFEPLILNNTRRSPDKRPPDTRPVPDKRLAEKTAPDVMTVAPATNVELLQKGVRLFNMQQWESALREFFRITADSFTHEERTELAYYTGLCCTKLKRFDEAVLYLEQTLSGGGDPMRGYQCRMILAFIYIKTGRAKMAEFELDHLETDGFESVVLYNTMAYAAYIQKRYLRAIELYEKALDIDKDNLTALNSLGYILADQGLDTLRGLRLCRKAADIQPRNAAYLDSLGWASYKCGRTLEAGKWLRRAKDLAPHEKEILAHLRKATGEVI